MSDTPVCTEVNVSASVGGKIQIVKFEYTSDYHYTMGQRFAVPESWSQQDIRDFRQDQIILLREHLEGIAQGEVDELMQQRDATSS